MASVRLQAPQRTRTRARGSQQLTDFSCSGTASDLRSHEVTLAEMSGSGEPIRRMFSADRHLVGPGILHRCRSSHPVHILTAQGMLWFCHYYVLPGLGNGQTVSAGVGRGWGQWPVTAGAKVDQDPDVKWALDRSPGQLLEADVVLGTWEVALQPGSSGLAPQIQFLTGWFGVNE